MITFHNNVVVGLSTVQDGSVRSSQHPEAIIDDANTAKFFKKSRISLAESVLVRLSYETGDYCKYGKATKTDAGKGFVLPQESFFDGIVTREASLGLFLPLADCIGAVLFDPTTSTLMLSHLGRHNLEQSGGTRSVEYLLQNFSVNPRNVQVYLSPAAGKIHYPLFAFNDRSLHDVATQQLTDAGVLRENIIIDDRDTVTDPDFFSHSASLKGEKPRGRHGIVCAIKK